jgi:4-amino-4-deoxychorismate lyase
VTVGPVAERVATARTEGVSVVTLPAGKSVDMTDLAPWQLAGAKTLSYAVNMAALRYAESKGAQDVIFVSSERFVLEGPRSTAVTVTGKSMVSPPVEHGVLKGTTTAALFEVAGEKGFTCEYAPVRPADLIVADSVWLISSVTLAARVNSLDGLTLPPTAADDDVRALVDLAVGTFGSK